MILIIILNIIALQFGDSSPEIWLAISVISFFLTKCLLFEIEGEESGNLGWHASVYM